MTNESPPLHPNHVIAGKPIPLYKSHKIVRALRIRHIATPNGADAPRVVTFRNSEFQDVSLTLPPELFARYIPLQGDYFVVYDDGYQSFSPWKAFLDGYSPYNPEGDEPKRGEAVDDSRMYPGSLVRLKSGGPVMTVIGMVEQLVDVTWMDINHHIVRALVTADVLQRSNEGLPEWPT